ncbi:recombinase family protein [Streptomyces prunicolor]|uniref:recombinase family protein n=1 Tax=Streptomyces prunicolor TaxID=67348 RepID=UPI0033F85DF2
MTTPQTFTGGDLDDLLAPLGGGALVGYARVSTRDQNLDRQVHALNAVGCIRTFQDKESGKDAIRPDLIACLDYCRAGDTLAVLELSRLGRSVQDLVSIVADLRRREIGFRSLHENLDTTTAGGRLVFHVFAALAEFCRELIVEGTHEGLAAARARGQRLGRPPALSAEQIAMARDLVGKQAVASIARLLGVSRGTLYNHLPELRPALAVEAASGGVELVLADGGENHVPGQLGVPLDEDRGDTSAGAGR